MWWLIGIAALSCTTLLLGFVQANFSSLFGSQDAKPPVLSACTLIRNEHEFIPEWIAHMIAVVGVQQLFIYDHGSSPPLHHFLSAFSRWNDTVVVRRTGDSGWMPPAAPAQLLRHWFHSVQQSAFQHCLQQLSGLDHVVILVDIDEFIYPCTPADPPVGEILRAHKVTEISCGKFGPQDAAPELAGYFAVERNLYRTPVRSWSWTEQLISWLALKLFSVCRDSNGGTRAICEDLTPPKYAYHTAAMPPSLIPSIGVHGVVDTPWPRSFAPTLTLRRGPGLCCNHYFFRSTANAQAKAKANANDEYTTRVRDQGVHAWTTLIFDPSARRLAPAIRAELMAACSSLPAAFAKFVPVASTLLDPTASRGDAETDGAVHSDALQLATGAYTSSCAAATVSSDAFGTADAET